MTTYTTTADSAGNWDVPFGETYTGGQKAVVTATVEGVSKSIEVHAPSTVTGGGAIQFSGTLNNFPLNIGEVTLSSEITGAIQSRAFYTDPSYPTFAQHATGLHLECNITSIQDVAFSGWGNILTLTLPMGLQTIGNYAFNGCNALENLTIPSTVTSIGQYAFSYCNALKTINLNEGLVTIQRNAFGGCGELTALTIPSTVTSIALWAFIGASKVKTLTFAPRTIELNVAEQGLIGFTALEHIYVYATTPPQLGEYCLSDTPTSCVVHVPESALAIYKSAYMWSRFAANMVALP